MHTGRHRRVHHPHDGDSGWQRPLDDQAERQWRDGEPESRRRSRESGLRSDGVPAELEAKCPALSPVENPVPDGYTHALCLTHDVDRPYKSLQGLFYALRERPGYHLRTALPDRNPYWQFESVTGLEDELGVRSSFYFLDEPHILQKGVRALTSPAQWVQQIGRYEVDRRPIADAIERLDEGGWEVGVHGSLGTADDPERLASEKRRIEAVLGSAVRGGRQHYLQLEIPETWRHYRDVGLAYDASYGSSEAWGFEYGTRPFRPFGDHFVVFPLTLMDQALPDPKRNPGRARSVIRSVLEVAVERSAVVTVLWHPRLFSDRDFPGFADAYEYLVRQSLAADGWVGPPVALRNEWEGPGGR